MKEDLSCQPLQSLTDRDPDLAAIVARYGAPPGWARDPGFATLLHIILEQQVSLASARAAYEKLLAIVELLTPQAFLALDDATLRAVGFSRQKAAYGRHLARDLLSGRLDLARLDDMDDDAARAALVAVKGIGPWTANIYLLMVLRRSDIWPQGDLALAQAAREVKGLAARPSQLELSAIADGWRPWRSYAARLLWHHYLSS